MLKKIGGNLITGKSILSISLPVNIFDDKSNLERVGYSLTYAPLLLEKAAKGSDPLEQMKSVLKFSLSTSIL